MLKEENLPLVGGQAVIEGVMMRCGSIYATAVRYPDGTIYVEQKEWFSLTKSRFFKLPFMRGFPTLIETLVNGIQSLNQSATAALDEENTELGGWHLAFVVMFSLLLAVGLFVVVPHLLSLFMQRIGLSSDIDGLSFHLWDGLFKCMIFVGYILGIALIPDIRRVFRYHGAEHKVIHAFEAGEEVSAESAQKCSRFHPRCGTTFLLFVLSIAIILHAVFVPLLMLFWTPENIWIKHIGTIFFKLILMIPISAVAYEIIRFAAQTDSFCGTLLRAPGYFLQMLTAWEPDHEQLEVGIAALAGVLGAHFHDRFKLPPNIHSISSEF